MSKLNYDHVVPRSKGGQTIWENIVASCYPCNDKKANRTPAEAGMTLLSVPTKPRLLPMRNELHLDPVRSPVEWAPYLVKAA
jgi:5-methylcytosine-specific restriction endonuclease McrA